MTNKNASKLLEMGAWLRGGKASEDSRAIFLDGGRSADTFYRQRYAYDKVVRSTHGVNCTGSCSWKVYVKDGVITWEAQQTDYPSTGPDLPDYEPRGCPRGAAFSWYEYSPTRIRYPYVRSVLLEAYRRFKAEGKDPVEAWAAIQADPQLVKAYKSARGRGGLVRTTWDEAMEIVAAANVSTIKEYGPDRIAGFTVLPAMSMVSFGAGSRYLQLIGGVNLSFYDWYADLPVASPQVFGDQTDVPESGDWFNSDYLIMWGSNVPLTRTPDAHFMTEARYHGQKVVVVSPDYADNTKFADEWLRVNPGTDGAVAQAMGHVILKEYHVGKQTPYFLKYLQKYSDSPFLLTLEEKDGKLVPGNFLTAADLPEGHELKDSENAKQRLLVWDADGTVKDPGGTLADRHGPAGAGKWNLKLDGIDPLLSLLETENYQTATVELPRFDLPGQTTPEGPVGVGTVNRGVPVQKVGDHLVTTVFDLLLANYGVARADLPGEWPTGYEDASAPGTPAWAEELTGVSANQIIRIARDFATNAEETEGRSMIIMGAGVNHYYHADTIYRTMLALTTMCGTQGVNGGGWAHYVGQEKVRPMTGWAQYSFALDWVRPPRHMIATGFWYFTTDQWRYDGVRADRLGGPDAANVFGDLTAADTLVEASQRGWMPTYPAFDRSSLQLGADAAAAGKGAAEYVAEELTAGRLKFACEDPDAIQNQPKVLFNWRTNLLGSSAKGTEFFLRHMLGADNDVQAEELAPEARPRKMTWRDEAPQGKLDLMVTADFRNTSTTLFSDVVLPAATWYEKYDLSSTDMHPYVHSFNAAINPPWEARTDFQLFQDLSALVSDFAGEHLGTQKDVISVPLAHDTPDEITGPGPHVQPRSECGWVPGLNMPKIVEVERDYTKILEKYNAIGPLPEKVGMGTKGILFKPELEIKQLARMNGTVPTALGPRPAIDTDKKAAEMMLRLSGTTNGRLATAGFKHLDERTGTYTQDLSASSEDVRITFRDVQEKPMSIVTSPEWSGSEHGGRRYSAFVINVEREKPWHTLSGRQHFFLDHDWIKGMGEALPVFRPPLDLLHLYGEAAPGTVGQNGQGQTEVAVRYLTVHNKWAIHSQYFDNIHMLTLGRGGQTVWMSIKDAEKIGVKDNDWIEVANRNGVVSARAVVSHRMPEGTVFMHHAQERTMNTPLNESTGKRGGTHNSLTRIFLKPSHLIGGHGQFNYAFNYIGPTGNQRDEVTVVRRRSQEVQF
ncbi:nitrate reductase subunit alpha [Boudabousia liubingyangii]|uniref:nitrate reductase subunit alpha n=1 Tax=Boudabousia liubingyangii TaxID=1921764 RepID=UPI00093F263E|nr:nitrate reductase subunit alpha [Boudabousia liubingyangii]OKL48334.1 nitrate reductase subunit alpha [Boudabousia liubingyangii]